MRAIRSEIFETGIMVIDVLLPPEPGGKAGLFGGAGVGKTVLLAMLKVFGSPMLAAQIEPQLDKSIAQQMETTHSHM